MKKYLHTLLLTVSVQMLFAQESKKVDFPKYDITLNSGYQHIDMKGLNSFYGDSFFVYPNAYKPLHHAFYEALQCNYRLSPMLSIGTQLKVDQASVEDRFTVLNRSIAVTAQLDGMAVLQKLIRKPIKDDWDLQLQAGLSYNVMQIKRYATTMFWCYIPEPWYYANRLGGSAQVKLSYPILKGANAQWRLGLNVGYQYAQSKEVSEYEQYVSGKIQKTVTLGFSGFNTGLSLTCEINKRPSNKLVGPSKNAIYVDLLGQSLYGAVMYERSLNVSSNGVQHSIAGGYFSFSQIPWSSKNRRMHTIPIAYNASFDFNRTKNLPNKLELGIGVTSSFVKEYGTSEKYRSQEVSPSIRIGYVYHSYRNGLLFKATMTPVLLGINRSVSNGQRFKSNGTYVLPMFGISIGKTF
ncbi:MAG: hypothetical protein RL207_1676 [Bacteroidota bacterium]|jgi:hypothetical protein